MLLLSPNFGAALALPEEETFCAHSNRGESHNRISCALDTWSLAGGKIPELHIISKAHWYGPSLEPPDKLKCELEEKKVGIESQERGPPLHLNAGKDKCISERNPHDLASLMAIKSVLLPQDLGPILYPTVP